MSLLFSSTRLGPLALQNRLVMAPPKRNRAIGNIPTDLMVKYYAQHAAAGLIITEGTSPSPNGFGYARIPGIYTMEQVAGWKRVTTAVHPLGAKIFLQLMHCGRVAHPLNLPAGAYILGPSGLAAGGETHTDATGMQPHATPMAMTVADIKSTIDEHARAAENALTAGFDGVELNGADGYLLEQFLRPTSNRRTDRYGGPIERRARFVLDVAMAVIGVVGKDKVGIRLSAVGTCNDMPAYPATEEDYTYLAGELSAIGLAYIHLVDHSSMGAPPVSASMNATVRRVFKRTLILSGGYDAVRAASDLEAGKCDLVGFGRPFLVNPDLVARRNARAALNAADMNMVHTLRPTGYALSLSQG